jgi:glutathione-regulated potassium-efflux system ancillary protein KefC
MNLTAIQVLDIMPLLMAFGLGFLARLVGLPPLLGFLASGFALGSFGFESSEGLEKIADVGVTLLLFTIGLKLDLRQLFKPCIWATSSLHVLLITAIGASGVMAIATIGIPPFGALDWPAALMLGFGLSFSSTVFAVKVFDANGEMGAMHGKVAIGVLIMQDLFAVAMMTIGAGKVPSPWSLTLLLLIPARPLILWILKKAGHGEMLVLTGWLIPLGGASLFEMMGIKADLGALLLGVLLAGTAKSDELSKALYSFKDLFLIGFFLSIGLTGALDQQAIITAGLLLLLLPIKGILFFWLFCRFRLRARSSTLTSLSLFNFSEFGLILVAAGESYGMLTSGWLVPMSLALAISFVISAPLNRWGKQIYAKWHDQLVMMENPLRLVGDEVVDTGEAKVLIFGMGRIGKAAYQDLHQREGDVVVGIERDHAVVKLLQEEGMSVFQGDATDLDYWSRKKTGEKLETILLTFPDQAANLATAKIIRQKGITARLASIATYDDQFEDLRSAGVDEVFNLYREAGMGFAEHVHENLHKKG